MEASQEKVNTEFDKMIDSFYNQLDRMEFNNNGIFQKVCAIHDISRPSDEEKISQKDGKISKEPKTVLAKLSMCLDKMKGLNNSLVETLEEFNKIV